MMGFSLWHLFCICNVAVLINTLTFDEEMESRVKTLQTLSDEFKQFFDSVDKAEGDTTKLFDEIIKKLESKVVTKTTQEKGFFDKYLGNKNAALGRDIKTNIARTDRAANSKTKTLGGFKRMTSLDLSEKLWKSRVDDKNFRTNQLTKFVDIMSKILTAIEAFGFEEAEKDIQKLETKQVTPEEQQQKQGKIKELKDEFYKLARFAAATQFHEEEKQRTEGQSGVKQIRTRQVGSKNYHSNTHSGGSFCAIHDHSNNIRTVGMGEFVGVLNGYEFRTRHNDYRLFQSSSTSGDYHKVENVEFPEVPPAVLAKRKLREQVKEMREWFKAWVNHDASVRDYTKYFKPVLVYLEGAWTVSAADGKIDEPFSSDRHLIDAKSWLDLQDKVRFTSYTGSKSLLENLAHLPTKITRFTEQNEPVLAQFNYRLVCHPISGKFSTKYFEPRYDSASQSKLRRDDDAYVHSRSAKFDIEGISVNGTRDQGAMDYNLLDSIMEQIPGKDNKAANIPGVAFDGSGDLLYSANPTKPNQRLNLGYYHRTFVQKSKDGKIRKQNQRGFSDRVYVAHSTQDRIAPQTYTNSKGDVVSTKVSFAIPVEVIFLTPLHTWNPFKIPLKKTSNGKGTVKEPYDGISDKVWYLTPTEFFTGGELETNPADTAKGEVIMKTPSGNHKVRASGTRIFFPKLDDIEKKVRQRYPIMPVHGEGSSLWKKLNALEDALGFKDGATYGSGLSFNTGISHSTVITGHDHLVFIDEDDARRLRNGEIKTLNANTETANGHAHRLVVALNPKRNQAGQTEFFIQSCDQNDKGDEVCFDHHSNTLTTSNQ